MYRLILTILCLAVALSRADDLENHDGYTGVWLRSDTAEVFVGLEPKFRLLAFRELNRESVFADSKINEQGLRLAFMEPEQIPASFDVGNQPATITQRKPRELTVRLREAAGLRYDVGIELAKDHPQLDLTYTLTNLGQARRRVACWSLISYALDGTIVAPFGDHDRSRRRLVLPWWSKWPQPSMIMDRRGIAVDASNAIEGNACKVGLISTPGWIGFVREQQALVSRVGFSFHAQGLYPEDGANLTFFLNADRCETEQLSPLTAIGPAESVRMRESLRIIPISPQPATPTAMVEAITQALPR